MEHVNLTPTAGFWAVAASADGSVCRSPRSAVGFPIVLLQLETVLHQQIVSPLFMALTHILVIESLVLDDLKGEAPSPPEARSMAMSLYASSRWPGWLAPEMAMAPGRMRPEGLEPSRVSPQDPKSCASASSATVAGLPVR